MAAVDDLMALNPSQLDRRITFQRREVPEDAGPMSAGSEQWADVATVWAWVEEMLPSRGERMVDGLTIALRPARIRIRYRADITADMQILYRGRTMQIMAPPIELGRREGLEMVAQDYSTAGGGN